MAGYCRHFFKEYAAEITFFLFKIAESMLEPTVRLFIYDGICLNLYPPLPHHHHHHLPLQSSASLSVGSNATMLPPTTTTIWSYLSDDTCAHLHHHPDRETAVQNVAARYMMYYKLLLNAPAMFLVLFCGAMSDRTGCKLPILLTCFGTAAAVVLYMVSVYIGPGGGAPYLPLFLIGAGVRGSFGRSAVMTMAVHSYVSDHSGADRRTQKISNLVATSHFGYLIGSSAAGVLLDRFGFVWVFLTVVSTHTASSLAAVLFMQEEATGYAKVVEDLSVDCKHEDSSTESANIDGEDLDHDDQHQSDEKTPLCDEKTPLLIKVITTNQSSIGPPASSVLVESSKDCPSSAHLQSPSRSADTTSAFESPSSVTPSSSSTAESFKSSPSSTGCPSMFKDSFMVLLRRREGSVRCQLVVLFMSIYVQQMMKSGEIDVLLLYVERTPMNMTKTTYGYFLSINYLCLGLSALLGPWILGHLLRLSDGTIAVIGLFARLAGLVVLCLSDAVWMVFLAAAIAGPHSLTVSSCKSMVSKMIGDGDMGKTFSLLSSGETLANLLGTVVFTNLYAETISIYAGSTFAVEGVVFVVLTVFIAVIGFKQSRSSAASQSASGQDRKGHRVYTSP